MSAELDMLRAISLCEELASDQARTEPIDGIIALAARQCRVDANELRTTWTAKLSAAATARSALPTRHRNTQPKGKS